MAEVFFKDKSKLFECKIFVEGTALANTQARLVMKFSENVNRLFYGNIDENNVFKVEIPALNEIKESKGEVVLEVIAENHFTTPWSSDVELKQSVMVERITKEDKKPSAPKVIVEMTEKEAPVIEKPKQKAKEPEKPKEIKKPVSVKDKLLELYNEHKPSITKEALKEFFPSYTASLISESYKLPKNEVTSFQYFLDKKVRPSKLNKIKNILK